MGKMIDAQSIVVAAVATGGRPDSPDAGTVLRSVFWHSFALASLVGVFVFLQAYVFPGMIPLKVPSPASRSPSVPSSRMVTLLIEVAGSTR